MQQHFEEERIRKENRLRHKQEKEEELKLEEEMQIREEEERAIREEKTRKKKEKRRREAEQKTKLKKDLNMQLVLRFGELEEKFVNKMRQAVVELQKPPSGKGKVVRHEPEYSGSSGESEASITQELSERTAKLVISEKRKRGPEKAVGNSPPMESPAKRTPKQGRKPATYAGRMTQARTKIIKSSGSAKRKTLVRMPLSARKKKILPLIPRTVTPDAKGALARYKYRNLMMMELKQLDASELQRICREKGVSCDGKVDTIFDIADHRIYLHFGDDQAPGGLPKSIRIEDSEAAGPPEQEDEEVTI
ncbi:hypothetical protein CBR_g22985 [Chara braunii]|uniref:Uncharacterized protein n=1 Tax=Chara braunii TaxID=69332 RepID=A0A388L378_CHABU|nr:hypothetical protein CBR_g22985 [Chara braunii]|eukprot:GBG76769.1 hypothetical protein CBR_g22985 [Chara braunii]